MDMDDLYNRWGQLKQQVEDDETKRQQQYQASLQPGDETTPADTWTNKAMGAVGLPQDWQTTVAQQKYMASRPQPVEAAMPAYANPEAAAEEGASLATQGAQKLAPELKQWAQQMMENPNAPIAVTGKINMNAFQKLRDALGHVGPVVMKGGG